MTESDVRTEIAEPQTVQRTLKYREGQEYMLRRLGSALVLQWDQLPNTLQDLLIDQAALVNDREDSAHEVADVEAFLRSIKSVAIAKPQG